MNIFEKNKHVAETSMFMTHAESSNVDELCRLLSDSRNPDSVEACDDLISQNYSSWVNQAGPDGNPILCHALAADNPKATAQLLLCGCDPDASMPDGREAVWEWSDRVLDRNRAVDTLASFMAFKEALPVELLLLPPSPIWPDTKKDLTEASMAAIKAMNPSDTVVLYHGTRASVSELARMNEDMVNFQRQGLQQRAGPTLAVQPERGFWLGVGFKVELPRSQVLLEGESNPDALVRIGNDGVGWIKTQGQTLDFYKIKGTPMASLSMRQWVEKNESYGVLVDGAEDLDRQAALAKSTAQSDALSRQAGQMRWSAGQSGRFGGGSQYSVEEISKESLSVLEQMAQISAEQKRVIDINMRISYLTALPASVAASFVLRDVPMSSALKAGAMAGALSEHLDNNNELRASTTGHENNISEAPFTYESTSFDLAHLILAADGDNSEAIKEGILRHNAQIVPSQIKSHEFYSFSM